MKAASIVMHDTEDGSIDMNVVFEGGFDQNSPAHAGIRRCLDYINGLGIVIQEPVKEPPKLVLVNG